MRWVLITPLGRPVEPEVNSTLATVSGVRSAKAASTCGVGAVAAKRSNGTLSMPAGGLAPTTTTTPSSNPASRSVASALA